jgi:hypothetical protein
MLNHHHIRVCVCVFVSILYNEFSTDWISLYSTWYGHHATGGHAAFVLRNSLTRSVTRSDRTSRSSGWHSWFVFGDLTFKSRRNDRLSWRGIQWFPLAPPSKV